MSLPGGLLPTPTTPGGGNPHQANQHKLFPTPVVWQQGGEGVGERFLTGAVGALLPTPMADQPGDTPSQRNRQNPTLDVVSWHFPPEEDGDEEPLALLPTPGGEDGEALLPTPTARDDTGAGTQGREGGMNLRTAAAMLPTPEARDWKGGQAHQPDLNDAIAELPLLATPSGSDAKTPDRTGKRAEAGHQTNLADQIEARQNWGKYEPAVRRWEAVTGVPAPPPTELNKNGKPRLAAPFAEWMMGWAPGHVTAVEGISRNDQLKIIGNGVCPQQAAAALQRLLPLVEEEYMKDRDDEWARDLEPHGAAPEDHPDVAYWSEDGRPVTHEEAARLAEADRVEENWQAARVRDALSTREKWAFLGAMTPDGYHPDVDGRRCYVYRLEKANGATETRLVPVDDFWAPPEPAAEQMSLL